MGKITFILGGARSGKSRYAINSAKTLSDRIAFIATCKPLDKEMKKRMALHRNKRPSHWKTFEEYKDISPLLTKIGSKFEVIIIDCLTLLISNLMLKGLKEVAIETKIKKMLHVLHKIKAQSIIVSNEVGLGIVPKNKLARDFRDIVGKINQIVTKESNKVFFMFSGIPLRIKNKEVINNE